MVWLELPVVPQVQYMELDDTSKFGGRILSEASVWLQQMHIPFTTKLMISQVKTKNRGPANKTH